MEWRCIKLAISFVQQFGQIRDEGLRGLIIGRVGIKTDHWSLIHLCDELDVNYCSCHVVGLASKLSDFFFLIIISNLYFVFSYCLIMSLDSQMTKIPLHVLCYSFNKNNINKIINHIS